MKFLCNYILDEWKYPKQHLSLQIFLSSSLNISIELEHCVSTNQDEYVLSMLYSYNSRNPEAAFYGYLGGQDKHFVCIWRRISKHAKVMGQILSTGKLLKCDPTKKLWIEMRIKLPYKVRHQLTYKEDRCDIFKGFKFVEEDNREMDPNLELVKDIKRYEGISKDIRDIKRYQ